MFEKSSEYSFKKWKWISQPNNIQMMSAATKAWNQKLQKCFS